VKAENTGLDTTGAAIATVDVSVEGDPNVALAVHVTDAGPVAGVVQFAVAVAEFVVPTCVYVIGIEVRPPGNVPPLTVSVPPLENPNIPLSDSQVMTTGEPAATDPSPFSGAYRIAFTVCADARPGTARRTAANTAYTSALGLMAPFPAKHAPPEISPLVERLRIPSTPSDKGTTHSEGLD
jgi:hypothetical protein